MHPVITPGIAVFSVIEIIDRQFGTPSPSAASRIECGTISSISSVVRATVGIIMIPRATPPANAEYPFVGTTIRAYTATPITIDGTPFKRSVE